MSKWFVTLPPEGGARQVALQAVQALREVLPAADLKVFDTRVYLDTFNLMLRTPDENMALDLMNQGLTVQVLDFKTTHLLVPALAPVTLFTLNLLRTYGVKTIHWFFEDHLRAPYWKEILDGYDLWCAIQRGEVQKECESRGVRFLFLPTAATPQPVPSLSGMSRTIDVAFVGIPSSYRVQVLEHLLAGGITLAIAGSGWNKYQGPLTPSIVSSQWTEGPAAARILQSAVIGLNLSVKDPAPVRDDVHLSPRVFEIPLHQCVLLSEDVPLFHEIMQGINTYMFVDKEDALNTIRTILSRQSTIGAELEHNKNTILEKHLYYHRMLTLMNAAA